MLLIQIHCENAAITGVAAWKTIFLFHFHPTRSLSSSRPPRISLFFQHFKLNLRIFSIFLYFCDLSSLPVQVLERLKSSRLTLTCSDFVLRGGIPKKKYCVYFRNELKYNSKDQHGERRSIFLVREFPWKLDQGSLPRTDKWLSHSPPTDDRMTTFKESETKGKIVFSPPTPHFCDD